VEVLEVLELVGSSPAGVLCLASTGIFLIGGILYWWTYGTNKR
jgi:hypothetical protein